jgi:hypothetical protein
METGLSKHQPNGQTWEFEYNDPNVTQTNNGQPVTYGSLSKITLPSGGTITYTYVGARRCFDVPANHIQGS